MDNVQLRCPRCSGPLTYEDRVCPHCGTVNEAAAAHVKELEAYSADFEKTSESAKERTKANAFLIFSALLLAVFVAGVIANVWFAGNMYDILDERGKSAAEADFDNIDDQLMAYLEAGEYLKFNAYLRFTEADIYSGAYRNYRAISDMTMSYWFVFRELSGLVLYEERDSSYVEMDERAMAYIVMGLNDFYNGYDRDQYRFYDDVDLTLLDGHVEKMDKELEAMMISYFGVTAAEYETIREYGFSGMKEEMEEMLWEIWGRSAT